MSPLPRERGRKGAARSRSRNGLRRDPRFDPCRARNTAGVGIDLCAEALDVARKNAARHGVADRATFAVGDWARRASGGTFDIIIVSNLPYLTREDLR
ncbi:MAG: methyltransferase domain-containing protein [Alphaproteobacteria bacterium]